MIISLIAGNVFAGSLRLRKESLTTYYIEQAVPDCALDGLFNVKVMESLFVLVLLLPCTLVYGKLWRINW